MVTLAEIPLVEAVKMITQTPASILGIAGRKGSLVPGKEADIVIFDDDIRIRMTIVQGRIVYNQIGELIK
jgi:N-acetylglucosamine-6-phosphate deacetylase